METFDKLSSDVEFVRSRGACFGVKLVRGAYIVKERQMASDQSYPDPVHACFEDTTAMFHRSIDHMMGKISREPDRFFTLIGSHNEDTVQFIVKRMKDRGIQSGGGSLFFGQTYGMCDHISSTLGQNGYLVFKSLPYGPFEHTMTYLARRALENSDALGCVQNDRKLLRKAFLDRCRGGGLTR